MKRGTSITVLYYVVCSMEVEVQFTTQKLLVMVREEMKLYCSLQSKRKRRYKTNMLRY